MEFVFLFIFHQIDTHIDTQSLSIYTTTWEQVKLSRSKSNLHGIIQFYKSFTESFHNTLQFYNLLYLRIIPIFTNLGTLFPKIAARDFGFHSELYLVWRNGCLLKGGRCMNKKNGIQLRYNMNWNTWRTENFKYDVCHGFYQTKYRNNSSTLGLGVHYTKQSPQEVIARWRLKSIAPFIILYKPKCFLQFGVELRL